MTSHVILRFFLHYVNFVPTKNYDVTAGLEVQ